MDNLSNKNILKNLIPFLAIFVVTIGYAGFQYVQDITGGASASENYDVQFRIVSAPKSTTKEWEWSIAVFAKNFSSPTNLDYKVNWCNTSNEIYNQGYDSKCEQENMVKFNHELTQGNIAINVAESIHIIKHQSVNCGTVELSLYEGPELLSRSVIDTGTRCSNTSAFGAVNLFSSTSSENATSDIIDDVYCNFYRCDGEDGPAERSKKASNPPTVTPGDPMPEPPRTPSDSDANFASKLAEFIMQQCSGGRVDGYNSLCMRGFNVGSKNDSLAQAKVMNSANAFHAYGGLQCVGFVKGAIAAQQGLNSTHSGNAASYAANRPPYTYFSAASGGKPRVNDLAVWTKTGINCAPNGQPFQDCGHIAYVTRVVDGNKFFVAEANRGCSGCARLNAKMYTTSDSSFGGFLRIRKSDDTEI